MKIALVGYGRMGREVERLATDSGHEIVARLDAGDYITRDVLEGAEVAVEFTLPETAAANLIRLAKAGVPVACGTTGWTHELERVRAAVQAAGTGLIWAPNFSLGVALFTRLVRRAASLVNELEERGLSTWDVHLHEAHHRHKVDAPSGTAVMLADELLRELGTKDRWVTGNNTGASDPSTLQITSTRAGEIPGTHTVGLEGADDRIILTHEARGRSGFARGALQAAEWIRHRTGTYSVDDWFTDVFGEGSGE